MNIVFVCFLKCGTFCQAFEAHSESVDEKLSLQGTLDDTAIQSLDTEQTPRGSLRGVDDTIESAELIHFSEEEDDDDSDKSETVETKTDRSTPTELIQTLAYGTVIGPTVKSLDDTSESSVRVSDREEHSARVKEVGKSFMINVLKFLTLVAFQKT